MFKRLLKGTPKIDSALSAVCRRTNLSIFKHNLSPRVIWGLVFMGVSCAVGWPAIGLLGIFAAYAKAPLIITVGGPVTYGVSQLMFILGAYLAGAQHAGAFFRWAARVTIGKLRL